MKKIHNVWYKADYMGYEGLSETLCGTQIRFRFTFKDVQDELQKISKKYPKKVTERIEQFMRIQMRKYAYLIEK